MNYVQALWRGVDRERPEDAAVIETSHPHFGRLVHFERFDGTGHWEAASSHPRTGARFTIVMPGDHDAPIQPFANFHRQHVGHPDVFLRRCADELRGAFERHTGRPLTAPCHEAFELEVLTLPVAARANGAGTASFHVAAIDTYFEVFFVGERVKHGCAIDLSAA